MAMYPNMMKPMPFMKQKNKHISGGAQEKGQKVSENGEQIKEQNNENQMQEQEKPEEK